MASISKFIKVVRKLQEPQLENCVRDFIIAVAEEIQNHADKTPSPSPYDTRRLLTSMFIDWKKVVSAATRLNPETLEYESYRIELFGGLFMWVVTDKELGRQVLDNLKIPYDDHSIEMAEAWMTLGFQEDENINTEEVSDEVPEMRFW